MGVNASVPANLTIDKILSSFLQYSENNGENENQVIQYLGWLSTDKSLSRSYPEISKNIYEMKKKDFDVFKNFCEPSLGGNVESDLQGLIVASLEFVAKNLQVNPKSVEKSHDNLIHFERHVRLSCLQRDYMTSITDKANKEADDAENVAAKAQQKVTKIYSEFVGILAIFTAMSFAMMGSVNILGSIFNKINHPTTGILGYALILAGIYLIVIYLLIMTLVLAMKKLFENEKSKYPISWGFVSFLSVIAIVLIGSGIVIVCFM